jgi:hypothetical protein
MTQYMSLRNERAGPAGAIGASVWSVQTLASALLLREANAVALLLLAGVPVLLGCWAILSPDVVLSSEMTWDLLFNLTGAWHLRFGHVAHVDFHDPVGALNFLLTELGFKLLGPSPRALLVGVTAVAATCFAFACVAAWRRLPLLPAALFVVFVCLLALSPANVGDLPNAYSFAMTYNRYGWSGTAIIALVLFLPPRAGTRGDVLEMAIVATLLVAMFHLKITYFVVGLANLIVALVVSAHVRARWRAWSVVLLIGLGIALAPFSAAYLADLVSAARAGIVRDNPVVYFSQFAENVGQYAPYFAAIAAALWLWWRGSAPLSVPVATTFLLFAALALLSQNSQAHGVPLAIVIAFLFYQHFQKLPAGRDRVGKLALLTGLLIFPCAAILASAISLAGYEARTRTRQLDIVSSTQLAGLAVPAEPDGMLSAFADGRDPHRLLNRARALRSRHELTPHEYIETLREATALLTANGLAQGKIVVLDQINPLPFMLALEPPRGGNLWSGAGAPALPAEAWLAEADHVLIPKFSTAIAWTERAQALYGGYLDQHFPYRIEGRSWFILSRHPPVPEISDAGR